MGLESGENLFSVWFCSGLSKNTLDDLYNFGGGAEISAIELSRFLDL